MSTNAVETSIQALSPEDCAAVVAASTLARRSCKDESGAWAVAIVAQLEIMIAAAAAISVWRKDFNVDLLQSFVISNGQC